jgi:hypothetical protein
MYSTNFVRVIEHASGYTDRRSVGKLVSINFSTYFVRKMSQSPGTANVTTVEV